MKSSHLALNQYRRILNKKKKKKIQMGRGREANADLSSESSVTQNSIFFLC